MFYLCGYMCACMSFYAPYSCRCLWWSGGVRFPGTGVVGDCEPHDVGSQS